MILRKSKEKKIENSQVKNAVLFQNNSFVSTNRLDNSFNLQ